MKVFPVKKYQCKKYSSNNLSKRRSSRRYYRTQSYSPEIGSAVRTAAAQDDGGPVDHKCSVCGALQMKPSLL
ncbi:hypothetical protein M758_4G106400 [Ceratodon purpureus]|nr:hypothetical protein M758_4G106400 [Ceratodon purpureus]